MNAKEFLNNVCKEIKYKPANKFISEELESHIEELKNDNLCKGLSEELAEETAVEQMGNPTKIGKRLNRIHRPKLDWKLILLIIVLLMFKLMIASNNSYIQPRNLKYMKIGLLLSVFIYFFDYRKTKKFANLIYFTATGILLFQWINWYFNIERINDPMYLINMRLWNVSIPLYIIAFAGYMADYKKEDFWDIIILYSISAILIFWQSNSITNTLILIMSYLVISSSKILKNKNIKHLIFTWIGTLGISIIIMILMTNMRVPYLYYGYTSEYDYNFDSKIAKRIENYEQEILHNLKWVGQTEQLEELSQSNTSQFRFLYLLGRLGIIPASILLLTILGICFRLIKNAKKIENVYGKYLIIGLSTTYIVQSVIHVLMNLNLCLRSDVNLPFVAEGYLYLLINIFTFAVILSVYRRKDINFEEPKKSKLDAKIEKFFWEEVEENKEVI